MHSISAHYDRLACQMKSCSTVLSLLQLVLQLLLVFLLDFLCLLLCPGHDDVILVHTQWSHFIMTLSDAVDVL